MGGRVAQRAPARPAAGASDDEVGRRFPVEGEGVHFSIIVVRFKSAVVDGDMCLRAPSPQPSPSGRGGRSCRLTSRFSPSPYDALSPALSLKGEGAVCAG